MPPFFFLSELPTRGAAVASTILHRPRPGQNARGRSRGKQGQAPGPEVVSDTHRSGSTREGCTLHIPLSIETGVFAAEVQMTVGFCFNFTAANRRLLARLIRGITGLDERVCWPMKSRNFIIVGRTDPRKDLLEFGEELRRAFLGSTGTDRHTTVSAAEVGDDTLGRCCLQP